MIRAGAIAASIAAGCVVCHSLVADTLVLTTGKDNTMYNEVAALSNGAGNHMFAGDTLIGAPRRALMWFDVGEIPPGSVVEGVELRLYMSRTTAGPRDATLHRLLNDWGEGDSQAEGNEGGGANATIGDATWHHTFFDDMFWSTPGGDFLEAGSATELIGGEDYYTWGSTPELVADVQAWVDDPDANFGWILIGEELGTIQGTAKRYDTREHPDPERRPRLTVTYSAAVPGDLNGDGYVNGADLAILLAQWGACETACSADLDENDVVNGADLAILLANWTGGGG